jgi:hypothetical protein
LGTSIELQSPRRVIGSPKPTEPLTPADNRDCGALWYNAIPPSTPQRFKVGFNRTCLPNAAHALFQGKGAAYQNLNFGAVLYRS